MSGTLKVGGKTLATHDTAANEISFHSDVMATTAQVQGVHTTATTAKATNANQLTSVTAVSGYSLADVSVGDYVTGEGIRVGTTVSAISGTTITLYHPDGDALSSSMTDLSGDPVSFYNATKALSPGTVAGGLCRAWVNFNGTGTVAIRAAYNVSSITDLGGTAKYAIHFTTAMPDTYYSWFASAGFDNFAQQIWVSSPSSVALATWKTTTQIQLQAVYANNTANADPAEFNVAIFR
jgi:hypothetical protein